MVGDGFPVRNLSPAMSFDSEVSPFLMLWTMLGRSTFRRPTDRAAWENIRIAGLKLSRSSIKGWWRTVTLTGNGGVIGPGDVQWMTAASGIVHEEFHEKEFAKKGGTLDGFNCG